MASNTERSRPSSDHDDLPHHPLAALIQSGISPKEIIAHMNPSFQIPDDESEMTLWRMIAAMIEPPRRKKLPQYNTLEDAVELIKKSSKIMVVSGAGISTSAGLPDFRSRDGIYKQIHAGHPDLDDPKQMFDIDFFRTNPLPFYQFAKALFPGQFQPTIGHQFIKCIEDHGKLLRNYTQNIDTLEMQAGIKKVVECHGSFAKATCTNCKHRVTGDDIREEILAQKVPKCPKCNDGERAPEDGLGVLKPNIVFFGEQLGNEFHDSIDVDKDRLDLLIVIGSSLKVRPVALIPRTIAASVPQILINREPLEHMSFDIELLGDCDYIIQELCTRLSGDWTKLCGSDIRPLREIVGPSELKIMTDKDDKARSEKQEESANKDDEVCQAQNIADEESSTMAVTNDPENDDNWEDVEIIDDSSSDTSTSSDSPPDDETCSVLVPPGSYVFLRPNRYIFNGAELTKSKYESLKISCE